MRARRKIHSARPKAATEDFLLGLTWRPAQRMPGVQPLVDKDAERWHP